MGLFKTAMRPALLIIRFVVIASLGLVTPVGVLSAEPEEGGSGEQIERERLATRLAARIEARLNHRFKAISVNLDIRPGVHELLLDEGTAMYVLGDSEHFILGSLYRFNEGESPTNITESESRKPVRMALLKTLRQEDLIIFPATGEHLANVTVFTDVDCGYCRKLHQQVPDLNAQGVEVRYAAFPRTGPDSVVAQKMIHAWCADDRQRAITLLKRGDAIDAQSCSHPVVEQYQLGQSLGVGGTPSLFTDDGRFTPGYLSTEELLDWLGI